MLHFSEKQKPRPTGLRGGQTWAEEKSHFLRSWGGGGNQAERGTKDTRLRKR